MSNIPLPPIGNGDFPLPDSKCSSSAGSAEGSRNNKLSYGAKGRYGRASRPGVRQAARKSPRKLPSLGSNSASLPPPSATYSSGSQTASEMASRDTARPGGNTPYLQRSKSEDCLKCMLKVPHKKCEGHRYIRIGGGYRHSYWYVKAMLEEIELRKQRELLKQQRLEAIKEGGHGMRAIKTYIRTKSGRLIEKIVWMTEDDYQAFQAGGKIAEDILKQYLSKEEANGLESWDQEEQKAITAWVRTKSGRLIQKTMYVSKADYDKMKSGELTAADVLNKYMTDGEKVEGWEEAKMKAIKTFVRTKSGRLIEKIIMVSAEDYEKMMELKRQGKDPNSILEKYMTLEDGQTLEGWEKKQSAPMKVVKAMIRTKSGRLVERTILMTEEEYAAFLATGGDTNFLKKFLDMGADDVIENWEKGSTVYSGGSDEELLKKAKVGSRIRGKDGREYEVFVDPITGKKYKRLVGGEKKKKKKGFAPGVGGFQDPNEKGMTEAQKAAYRQGKRRPGSDSDYSYKSFVSAGGTRHVKRKRRRADGTYSNSESYHSSQDEGGKKRRQKRRNARKAVALKEAKKRFKQGKRNEGSDSDYSYKSFVSAGGTRHVKRKRRRADGTYSNSESYHSSQDEAGQKRRKARRADREKAFKQGKRNPGSDSDFSYKSYVSAGGTRHVRRRKKRADGTYSDSESYHSSQDEGGKARRKKRREQRQKALKQGKRNPDSDSDFSYKSYISAGGTRHVRRRHRRADGTYSNSESYHSSLDEDGKARRRKRRRDRKHAGSAHSYYSEVSAGGTRHVKRRRRRADGTYSNSESYHSDDSAHWEKKGRKKKKAREHGSDSDYSYKSEVSAGGTRRRTRRKRVRDKDGNIIGHGDLEEYSSDSNASYELVPDGKGGFKKVLKESYKLKKQLDQMTDFSGSLRSTDSDDEPDFSKMTEEEKKKYFEDKAKRKAERERRRREKYGDKYDEMMDKHKKAKDAKKAYKSMVTYEKGASRFGKDGVDDREPGLGWDEYTDEHGRKVRRRKDSQGNVIEEYTDEHGRTIRRRTDSKGQIVEEFVDKDGKVITRTIDKDGNVVEEYTDEHGRKIKRTIDADGNVVEEFIDEHGNLVRRTRKGSKVIEEFTDKDGNTVRKIKHKDGSEWEEVVDEKGNVTRRRIKSADEESLYEYERDADGNILYDKDGNPRRRKIGTIKKGKGKDGIVKEDDDYIYKYDQFGNLMRIKKGDKEPEEVDNGDYFEMGPDGKLRLKAGRKKIDITKLTAEELAALGIDLKTMSKEEIARILKEKFGDDIEIIKDGKKIGLRHIDDYGSDANTDDLAADSDLDISTLKGAQRFRVLMKRGGQAILDHIKKVIQDSKLTDDSHVHPDERDHNIDFLKHYKLVDETKLDSYARAFVVEDDDFDGVIYPREAKLALENVQTVKEMSEKQLQYILKLLDIDRETNVTFRMFSVMTALAERVTNMDKHCKKLIEISELSDIERKMELYRNMFYCNVSSDRDPNYIQVDSLRIDLMAGGLNWKQQEYIMGKLNPTEWDEISFLDYLAYIPLFLSMHDNMCNNPLDMSPDKYGNRQPSAAQRDQNPLGQPLKKETGFIEKHYKKDINKEAVDILSGRVSAGANQENRELFDRYQKLPHISSHSHPTTAKKKFP